MKTRTNTILDGIILVHVVGFIWWAWFQITWLFGVFS